LPAVEEVHLIASPKHGAARIGFEGNNLPTLTCGLGIRYAVSVESWKSETRQAASRTCAAAGYLLAGHAPLSPKIGA
jgi:hypothetical protein